MADYHSLLSRAVANLPKPSPPAARKAIYDRARSALINQLRSLKPQLPDSDIAREEAALDEAIARLEAEHAPPPAAPAPAPAPARPIAPPPRPRPPPPPPPARAETSQTPPTAPATPVPRAAPAAPIRPPSAAAPAASRAPPLTASPPPRSPAAAAPTSSRAPSAAAAEPPQLVAAAGAPSVASRAAAMAAPAARKAPERKAPEPGRPLVASDAGDTTQPDNAPKIGSPVTPETPAGGPGRLDPEPPRPIAPSPRAERRTNPWLWIGLAVVVGLVGSVAVAALLLHEKPQDLAIKDPTATATPGDSAANGQKIAQRVDGAPTPAEPAPQASLTPTPTPTPPSPAPTPAAELTPAATPSPSPAPSATQTPVQAAIPVAARAAMLVADGADTQKPTVSVGSVVWSPAPAIPGQPGSVGVKADIDIPDLRMHASMVLRKNVDPGLPASHTIDFRVSFDPGSPIKGVKDIALPLMRRDDPPAADALLGVRVKINDGYYLVGLNRADADVARNVDEIGTRGWFDFPMQLSDDRIAKLTFEKSTDGDRIVADALAAWK